MLNATVPVVDGVYDDHDYGLNDGGKYHANKQLARRLFLDRVVHAPSDSPRRTQAGGIYASRTFGARPHQLKLVMLDTRFSRDDHAVPSPGAWEWLPKPGYAAAAVRVACAVLGIGASYKGDVLGEEQWRWLEAELRNSTASAHLIVSSIQVLTTSPAVESWGHFPAARARLLELLRDAAPAGALLLTGDVHYAELIGTTGRSEEGGGLLEVTSSGINRACGGSLRGAMGRLFCEAFVSLWHRHRLPEASARRPRADERRRGSPLSISTEWLGAAVTDDNTGTISIEPAHGQQWGEMRARVHDEEGEVLLEAGLPLGLGAAAESRRWSRALDELPGIWDEGRRIRALAGTTLLVLVLTRRLYTRRRWVR